MSGMVPFGRIELLEYAGQAGGHPNRSTQEGGHGRFRGTSRQHDIATLPEGPFIDVVNDNADQLQSAALRLSAS